VLLLLQLLVVVRQVELILGYVAAQAQTLRLIVLFLLVAVEVVLMFKHQVLAVQEEAVVT